MEFDLFKKENEVIEQAQDVLNVDTSQLPAQAKANFEKLLAEYKKLSKHAKRLIKLSDRNEKKLREASDEIAAQKEELERRQVELVQAEKLASLGQLVSGVAHELNTPLGIILTSSSALRADTHHLDGLIKGAKARKSDVASYMKGALEICDLLENHSQNASDLISSFKAVSVDRACDDKRSFQLGPYIEDVVRSLLPTFKNTQVKIECQIAESIELTSFPGAFNQVITNLILNALKHGFDEGKCAGLIDIKAHELGDDVEIVLSDNGKGIAVDMMDKIFDPFVTSARDTGGTGLGLHIVHNIITAKFKGRIEACNNKNGKGACFTITMPLKNTS